MPLKPAILPKRSSGKWWIMMNDTLLDLGVLIFRPCILAICWAKDMFSWCSFTFCTCKAIGTGRCGFAVAPNQMLPHCVGSCREVIVYVILRLDGRNPAPPNGWLKPYNGMSIKWWFGFRNHGPTIGDINSNNYLGSWCSEFPKRDINPNPCSSRKWNCDRSHSFTQPTDEDALLHKLRWARHRREVKERPDHPNEELKCLDWLTWDVLTLTNFGFIIYIYIYR